jgi:membrane-bound ClpP family serine protease
MERPDSRFSNMLTSVLDRRPLLFFGICGIVAIVLGIAFGVRVISYLVEKEVLLTGTALISALLLGAGILSVFTGAILRTLSKRNGDH